MQASFPYSEKILHLLSQWDDFADNLLEEINKSEIELDSRLDRVFEKLRLDTKEIVYDDIRAELSAIRKLL